MANTIDSICALDTRKVPDLTDRSPENISWMNVSFLESFIKAPLRRSVYGAYSQLTSAWLSRKYQPMTTFEVDTWLWGQRGNDYASHRRRLNRQFGIRDKKIFIAGCGTGRDAVSWLRHHPANLVGLDYFNYAKAWRTVTDVFREKYPRTAVSFRQGDLNDLSTFGEGEFDIVGSDAVFEHLKEPSTVCREWNRILKPGGILYATFGPLWYGWHGDHFSGWDCLETGFNHIALSPQEYQVYLDQKPFTEHSEEDGRTWIENGLFSYLKPAQYLDVLAASGFDRKYVGVIIEPRALACLERRPVLKHELTRQHSLMDLLICGMTVIYHKPKVVA